MDAVSIENEALSHLYREEPLAHLLAGYNASYGQAIRIVNALSGDRVAIEVEQDDAGMEEQLLMAA